MLGRRDFLKLLGLGGAAVVAAPVLAKVPPPPPLWVPPEPERRYWQLDQTMANPHLPAEYAERLIRRYGDVGTLLIGDVPVGRITSWSWDQVPEYGFSGYNSLHTATRSMFSAELEDVDHVALQSTYVDYRLADLTIRYPDKELVLKDMMVGSVEHGAYQVGLDLSGRALYQGTAKLEAMGVRYRRDYGQ